MCNKVENTERCREQAEFIFSFTLQMKKLRLNERLTYLSNNFFSLLGENIASLIKMNTKTLNFQKLSLSTEWTHRTVFADWLLSKGELAIASPSAANSLFQPCWVMKVFCQLIIVTELGQKRAKEGLNQGSGNRSRNWGRFEECFGKQYLGLTNGNPMFTSRVENISWSVGISSRVTTSHYLHSYDP